jgi:hypothetical protein
MDAHESPIQMVDDALAKVALTCRFNAEVRTREATHCAFAVSAGRRLTPIAIALYSKPACRTIGPMTNCNKGNPP